MLPLSRTLLIASFLVLGLRAVAEDLDLTRAKTVDWLRDDQGKEEGVRVLLSPTDDPRELAGILKKSLGVRLSSEDSAHTVVIAMGPLAAGGNVTITQATIDRFRHLVEVEVQIAVPASEKDKKRAGEAKLAKEKEAERALPNVDVLIGPAKPAKAAVPQNAEPARPTAVAGAPYGNPALFLPAGKLEPGRWWVRVKASVKEGAGEGERNLERPPLTDSFVIKDQRPLQKGEKGRNTPEVGLERPNSPSATQGLGF